MGARVLNLRMIRPRADRQAGAAASRADLVAVLFFVSIVLFLFVLPQFVFYIYFPVAFLVGLLLLLVAERSYIELCWWLWFVTPFVRRVTDLSVGYTSASPVMLAPFAVSSLCAIRLFPRILRAPPIVVIAFAAVCLALFYGFLVGVNNAGIAAAAFGFANWLEPVIFGAYLASRPEQFASFAAATRRAFVFGGAVLGAYGVYQFFYLPPWDAFWMVNASLESQGAALPTLVRVFGTLNSSAPYALVLMVDLLFVLAADRMVVWLAGIPAVAGILLSLVRTSWLGLAVGVAVLMAKAPVRRWLQVLAAVGMLSVLVLYIINNYGVGDFISSRIESLLSLSEDQSYQERASFYHNMIDVVLSNFVGNGMGTNGTAVLLSDARYSAFRDFDNGILAAMFTLGVPAGLLYFVSLLTLYAAGFFRAIRRGDPRMVAAAAILTATLFHLLSLNVCVGIGGTVIWGMLGLLLAARRQGTAPRPQG